MKPSRPEPRCEDSRPSSLVSRPLLAQRAPPAGTGEQRTTMPDLRGVPFSGPVAIFRKSAGRHHHKDQICQDARTYKEGPAPPVSEGMIGLFCEDQV